METINYSATEAQIISVFNAGHQTVEAILDKTKLSSEQVRLVLSNLIALHVIKYDKTTQQYEYDTPIIGESLLLDGNALLPMTILKYPDRIIVSRGKWYEFEPDFDIRRIIWNVQLKEKKNSTLLDMINASILKEKKSKIVQLPEYEQLRNKIIPYSPKIGLQINAVGAEHTDVHILLRLRLSTDEIIAVEHKGFKIPTLISTQEMLGELKSPTAERDYQNIELNKMYDFDELIFSGNEFPIKIENNTITYAKITGVRKSYELTIYSMGLTGINRKLDVENYDNAGELATRLKQLSVLLLQELAKQSFNIE